MASSTGSVSLPSTRTILAVIGVVCLLVVPTGAVLVNEVDRLGANDTIVLQPSAGPNGAYAFIDADRQLTINISDAGVNPEAKTDIRRVFTITNTGPDDTQVWVTHTNDDAVTFYDDASGTPLSESSAHILEPTAQLVVSISVDTTGPNARTGDTLVTSLFVHTRALTTKQPLVSAPSTVDLGNVTVGQNTTATVDVHNPGNATLALSEPTVSGGSGAFSFVDESLPAVAPGETVSLDVRFAPTSPGAASAILSFVTNASNAETVTVNATGYGVPRALQVVSETPITFDTMPPGTTRTETVTVRNEGATSLTIATVATSGGDATAFTVDAETPIQLAPDETAAVSVSFTPPATGDYASTLTFTGVDGTDLTTADIEGRGAVRSVDVVPSTVEFGGVGVNRTANATVTLTSTGTDPVTVSVTGFGGSDPGQFASNATGTETVLAPGDTMTIPVQFVPDEAGNHSALLTLDTNRTTGQTLTVPVSGEGLPPKIGVGDDNLDFGNVIVGSSRTLNVTVWNEETSPADLTVHTTTIVGQNPDAFTITNGRAPFTLAPGEERDIQITYQPETDGIKTAQLRILSDAGNQPQIDVWMSNAGWRIRVQQIAPDSHGVDGADEPWALDPDIVNPESVRVELDADDIPANTLIDVNVSQPQTRVGDGGIDEIRFTSREGGSFDMNFLHAHTPATRDSPTYVAPRGRHVVQYVTLLHSIPNDDIDSPSIVYRVKRSAVPDGFAPTDVEFRRYVDDEWTLPDSTFVRETPTHYVYRVDLPGLSEFVITGPDGTESTSDPDEPDTDTPDEDDPGDDDPGDDDPGDDPPENTTVTRGDTTLTFPTTNGSADLASVVSVVNLPVPAPESSRTSPDAAISTANRDRDIESTIAVGDGVSVNVVTEDRYRDAIHAAGADAMTLVERPLPLTASHSLFGTKNAIDDHWRMVRQLEITVPPEYEDRPAIITLRMPKAAFADTDPEDAVLARQHDGWQLLDTTVVEETSTEVVLQAETPGFSVFAVFADNEVSYEWTVEGQDGTYDDITIEPTFTDPGFYNVTLTITDAFGLTDTAHYRILANDVPAITLEQGGPVLPNQSVMLVADVTDELGNVTIEWHFSDDSTTTGRVVEHAFPAGLQTVEVVATDEYGARSTISRQFVVGGLAALDLADLQALAPDLWLPLGLLGLLLLLLVAWRYRGLLLGMFGDHGPAIINVAPARLELDRNHVVVPELQARDYGGDLDTITLTLRAADGTVVASGTGDIDGRRFDAVNVVLDIATDTVLDRGDTYDLDVSFRDRTGATAEQTVAVSTDPFVYPHGPEPDSTGETVMLTHEDEQNRYNTRTAE